VGSLDGGVRVVVVVAVVWVSGQEVDGSRRGEVRVGLEGVKPGSGNFIHSNDSIGEKETILQVKSDDKR